MSWLEALILGLIQGLTEFLPVSSSGHLELGSAFFGLQGEDNLTFSIIVHGATFLSILVVFRKDIVDLFINLFKFQWNNETKFILLLIISAVPVALAGVFLKDHIELLFNGNILLVGFMLLVTASLLFLTKYSPQKKGEITFKSAILIGIAQTIAIIPGISRSGATISTALYLGIDREKATRFSFLMVLIPIFGASLLEVLDLAKESSASSIGVLPLIVGAIAAFTAGLLACNAMINIVKKGKIVYFSIYCLIIGLAAISYGLFDIL
ncbi:MAG: undecaprenyl-diphosphate phosphatase [Bacteroidetes bacterium]|nr:undecaprenyl-diphosphate phosphatase [Bacteroidota bacterium]